MLKTEKQSTNGVQGNIGDTSILIDYYRKTDKNKTAWITLVRRDYSFAISAITKYEIYSGATAAQLEFWDTVLSALTIMPLDEISVDTAVVINSTLKKKHKQIVRAKTI